jgi:uncharacterized membrane-anchored protein
MKSLFGVPLRIPCFFGLGLALFLSVTPVFAANPSAPQVHWVSGAQQIKLGDDLATLTLPKEDAFANSEDTAKLLEYMGNTPSPNDLGLVISKKRADDWMVVFSYDPIGYVKDDDAQSIDKNSILENIKEATDEGNKRRKDKGIPALEIEGWAEEPHYDAKTHNLVWAIAATSEGRKIINYNTRKLGRNGVTSINLVVDPNSLASAKPKVENLVANYEYIAGKQYGDFIPGKDKAAEIGLTALIAGGAGAAAVKTGFFAKFFLPLLIGLKKLWIILVGAAIGLYRKFVGGKKQPTQSNESNDDALGLGEDNLQK